MEELLALRRAVNVRDQDISRLTCDLESEVKLNSEKTNTILILETNCSELRSTIEKYKEKLSDSNNICASLQEEIDRIQKDAMHTKLICLSQSTSVEELRRSVSEYVEKVSVLNSENHELKLQLMTEKMKLEEIINNMSAYEDERHELHSKISQLEGTATRGDELMVEIELLKNEADSENKRYHAVVNQLNGCTQRCKKLEEALNTESVKKNTALSEVREYQDKVKRIESQAGDLLQRLTIEQGAKSQTHYKSRYIAFY